MQIAALTGMTPNQLVAHNLTRARELRGWSQAEAVNQLRERAGVVTSAANLSAAERSVTGNRRREFDADDLLAYARTFQLPITWFLLPPDSTTRLHTQDDPEGLPPTLVLDWLYHESAEEDERLQQLTQQTRGDTNYQHAAQQRARHYIAHLAAAALAEYPAADALRALADGIDDVRSQ